MNGINSEKLHEIKVFFDKTTSTLSYVVYDELEKKCAVIDSVLRTLSITAHFFSSSS